MSDKAISSRKLIERCGGDPDKPLGRISFPSEMRERAPDDLKAVERLQDRLVAAELNHQRGYTTTGIVVDPNDLRTLLRLAQEGLTHTAAKDA